MRREDMTRQMFRTERFLTIRKKILIIAIFATLVPSLLLGWVSYYQTHNILESKAMHELDGALERTRRAMDAWLQQQLQGLRSFSSSFVLVDNLSRLRQQTAYEYVDTGDSQLAITQIDQFIRVVQDQLPLYSRLLVLDVSGNVVTQFPSSEMTAGLETNWIERIDSDRTLIFARLDDVANQQISLGVQVVSAGAEILGLLVAEIPLTKLTSILEFSADPESEILLVRDSGEILLSSHSWKYQGVRGSLIKDRVDLATTGVLLDRYSSYRGEDVVSRSLPFPRLSWHLVVEKSYQSVFTEVDRLRNVVLLLTLLFLVGFALLAYMVSQSILRPLNRLTQAAAAVADGDLGVSLTTSNRDELGFTMMVFNDMVKHLRTSRDELEKISITDSLTALYNRKHIMDLLALQFSRYRRNSVPFSLLLVDIDHFKQINDRYGHQAGDAALRQAGVIFHSVLRDTDSAGRYGGEEFLIILEQTTERQAVETAERLRATTEMSDLLFDGQKIRFTVSIGIATVMWGVEDTIAGMIQRADRRLYLAKRFGRNRVYASDDTTESESSAMLQPIWR